ncbi:MAG: arginine--tRNA ligase [Candidatus Aenigmatarchaeota archaeon]
MKTYEKCNKSREVYTIEKVYNECKRIISKSKLLKKIKEREIKFETPRRDIDADIAIPCFSLHEKPLELALKLADFFNKYENKRFIKEAKAINAYLNLKINYKNFSKEVVSEVLRMGDKYGSSNIGNGKCIIIDYSSPNIAKPMNVGHLRSTIIGQAIYNILTFLGYKCVGDNHLGDIGTQFGKLIVAYKLWGNKDKIEKDPIKELMRLYVRFHKESDKHLEDEAKLWSKKLEDGDKEALEIWRWIVDISKKEFQKIYKMLGIKFDLELGESFYLKIAKEVVEDALRKGIAKESENALVVNFEDLPPLVIQRSDKASLYQTRDIATIKYRKERFHFYKCLYVVGSEQKLYFKQVFRVAEMLGYIKKDECIHVDFGLMRLKEGKMSTREGRVILLEDLINRAIELSKSLIKEAKNEEEKDEIAKKVGIGAIIFNDLKEDRIKDVVFDWDKALSIEGDSCPYVQYACVRAKSIIDKYGKEIKTKNLKFENLEEEEKILIRRIADFPKVILMAANSYKPHYIAQYLLDVADAFNKFYEKHKVIGSEKEKERVAIVKAAYITLKVGLKLLNIEVPEKM